jgi:ribonuclease BN (tRNA processing enzyme)
VLTLTVLGCDGSHAGAGGAASGYLVRSWSSGTSVWMDAGSGTFANLQRFCDPLTLDAIVLSHQHDDHWIDVQGFLVMARWTATFARPPIAVYAAPGIRARLSDDVDGILDWHEVGDGDGCTVGDLQLSFSRTDHPPPTLAVRVERGDKALGYSSDSGPAWSLASLGQGLDLALCEATYTQEFEETTIHMSARQAATTAREAGVRRLVLTHRWPTISAAAIEEEATAVFTGALATAAIGRGYSL